MFFLTLSLLTLRETSVLCPFQPINNQCCVRTSPCDSYYDGKMPFSNNHQETLKEKGYSWQDLGIAQSEDAGREKERRRESLGFCFYWGPGWGPKVSRAHSLKQDSRNLRRNKQVAQMVSYWNHAKSLKQRSLNEGSRPSSSTSPVAGNVFIGDRCLWSGCLFEVDAIKAFIRHLHYKKKDKDYTTTRCHVVLWCVERPMKQGTERGSNQLAGRN